MSKYAEFDAEMLRLINGGCDTATNLTVRLRDLAEKVDSETEPYRVVDRRLQYLRKKGEIMYYNKRWWGHLS